MKLLACCLFTLVVSPLLLAQDGQIDSTFGGTGIVKTFSGFARGYAVALQADGKILVAGTSINGDLDYDFAVARFGTNGSLDTTFGYQPGEGGGVVVTAIGTSYDEAYSVAVQVDGKIVVAGYGDQDFALVRYNSNGNLDSTFDADGKVSTTVSPGWDGAMSIVLQEDGKIVAAGGVGEDSIAVVRYNSNGSVDSTFDSDGKVFTAVGSASEGHSVALQADGKIVVAGNSYNGSNYDFALVRYKSDGGLDSTFDGDGKVTTAVGSSDETAESVAIQADGKIVVAGYSTIGADYDFALVRYKSDGSLDSTFDVDGKVTTAVGGSSDRGNSVVLQANGKIVVAGRSYSVSDDDFAVVRYNSDGSFDGTLNTVGMVTTTGTGIGEAVALQADGKIVVAGTSDGDGFCVARYTGSSGPLPIQLASFIAITASNGVLLEWMTVSEVNNYGFEIERRAVSDTQPGTRTTEHGTTWTKVGFVPGSGTSTSPKEYSYLDRSLPSGRYAYRIKQIDLDGSFQYSLATEIVVGTLPLEFSLAQNYPNPFNPSTTIRYALAERSRVRLDVYNLLGQRVQTLVDEEVEAGYQSVVWDAGVSTGLYFYRIEAASVGNVNGRFVDVKKMIVVR